MRGVCATMNSREKRSTVCVCVYVLVMVLCAQWTCYVGEAHVVTGQHTLQADLGKKPETTQWGRGGRCRTLSL